ISRVDPPDNVKSVDRAVDILELAAATDHPITHREIKLSLGLPGSSLTYLLRSLTSRNYLSEDQEGRYVVGASVQRLVDRLQLGTRLGVVAQSLVDRVGQETGEATSFVVLKNGEIERIAG